MIYPVNSNINFKSFNVCPELEFSEKQKNTVEDIKAKLGNRIKTNTYNVNPGCIADTVELWEHQTVDNNRLKRIHIGTYDEQHPFNGEDCNNNQNFIIDDKRNVLVKTIASVGTFGLLSVAGIKKLFRKEVNNLKKVLTKH